MYQECDAPAGRRQDIFLTYIVRIRARSDAHDASTPQLKSSVVCLSPSSQYRNVCPAAPVLSVPLQLAGPACVPNPKLPADLFPSSIEDSSQSSKSVERTPRRLHEPTTAYLASLNSRPSLSNNLPRDGSTEGLSPNSRKRR